MKPMPLDFSSEPKDLNYTLQLVYKEAEVDPKPLCTLSPLPTTGGALSELGDSESEGYPGVCGDLL